MYFIVCFNRYDDFAGLPVTDLSKLVNLVQRPTKHPTTKFKTLINSYRFILYSYEASKKISQYDAFYQSG